MQQQLSICQENNSFPPDRFHLVQEDPKALKSLLLAQFEDELVPRAVFVLLEQRQQDRRLCKGFLVAMLGERESSKD